MTLDFGDAFFVRSLLHQTGYGRVLDALPCGNRDTLLALLTYRALSSAPDSLSEPWYRGDFASVLYPNADLSSGGIARLCREVGNPAFLHLFFETQIRWVKEEVCDDSTVILWSRSPSGSLSLWAVISGEDLPLRLCVPFQRDSGLPLLFEVASGGEATVQDRYSELNAEEMIPELSLIPAEYASDPDFAGISEALPPFAARLAPEQDLYGELIRAHAQGLIQEKNLMESLGKWTYVKRAPFRLGDQPAYAFLGVDRENVLDALVYILDHLEEHASELENFPLEMDRAGLFVVISSLPLPRDEILTLKQSQMELNHFLTSARGRIRPSTFPVDEKRAVFGHIALELMASTIAHLARRGGEISFAELERTRLTLRSHRCTLDEGAIQVSAPSPEAELLYASWQMDPPASWAIPGD